MKLYFSLYKRGGMLELIPSIRLSFGETKWLILSVLGVSLNIRTKHSWEIK